MMKFGDYLRARREDKGWTQPEAAAKADIEQSYLSKLETGKSFPSQDVFERLAAAYGFDAETLAQSVDAESLKALREVGQVRAAVISLQSRSTRLARSWLAAGVACVFLGGASLGLFSLAEDDEYTVYHYTSPGVIAPGEDMNVYAILDRTLRSDLGEDRPDEAAARALQVTMMERADPQVRVTRDMHANGYLERVEGGQRFFRPVDSELVITPSPLRWFLAPAIMFLLGALGCFFVSFRWK
jgi:transcriptional regulator with XRE-family HTH domain